jgi:hypothetical protein
MKNTIILLITAVLAFVLIATNCAVKAADNGLDSSNGSSANTGYYKIYNPDNASPEEIKTASDVFSEINGQMTSSNNGNSKSIINGSNSTSNLLFGIQKAITTETTPLNKTINGNTSGTIIITGNMTSSLDDSTGIGNFSSDTINLVYNNFCDGGNYTVESGAINETETGTYNAKSPSIDESIHVICSGAIVTHKNSNSATKYNLTLSNDFTIKINGTQLIQEGTFTYTMTSAGVSKTWTETRKDIYTFTPPTGSPLPFKDDFNRADSSAVNNGWLEAEGFGDAGTLTDISILKNELILKGGLGGTNPKVAILNRAVSFNANFTCTMRFKFSNDNANYTALYLMTASTTFTAILNNNVLSIFNNNNTAQAVNIFHTFPGSTYYKFVLVRNGTTLTISILDDTTNAVWSTASLNDSQASGTITNINLDGGYYDINNSAVSITNVDYIDFKIL